MGSVSKSADNSFRFFCENTYLTFRGEVPTKALNVLLKWLALEKPEL